MKVPQDLETDEGSWLTIQPCDCGGDHCDRVMVGIINPALKTDPVTGKTVCVAYLPKVEIRSMIMTLIELEKPEYLPELKRRLTQIGRSFFEDRLGTSSPEDLSEETD